MSTRLNNHFTIYSPTAPAIMSDASSEVEGKQARREFLKRRESIDAFMKNLFVFCALIGIIFYFHAARDIAAFAWLVVYLSWLGLGLCLYWYSDERH